MRFLTKNSTPVLAVTGLILLSAANLALGLPDTVLDEQKISDLEGGFAGVLDNGDHFGWSVASLGDLDGDDVTDVAIGARSDGDGGSSKGAVWILFLNADGTVKADQKISDTQGNFTGVLNLADHFGTSIAAIGDLDGDQVTDLAVGAFGDDEGGALNANRGSLWILFMNGDGTVKSHQKISDVQGNFTGGLDDGDLFGRSVSSLGDLDGDGVVDLAVGAMGDSDGGAGRGAMWILFLNSDGTVKEHQKINETEGGFTGGLDDGDSFGISTSVIGDLDEDGVTDLAVGARLDDDGGPNRGAVWILFLHDDGTVKAHQKISATEGCFTGTLANSDALGISVAALSDVNDDGVLDLAVGASGDNGGLIDGHGAAWILFLNFNGTVKSYKKINETEGGFSGNLDFGDRFGWSLGSLGDLDGDGEIDLIVGAPYDDDGGSDRGAAWVLFLGTTDCQADLNGDGMVEAADLAMLLGSWGPCGGDCCAADFNGDDIVDAFDLAFLLGSWGSCA